MTTGSLKKIVHKNWVLTAFMRNDNQHNKESKDG